MFRFNVEKKLQTKLHQLTFASPIIASSFKDDMGIIRIWIKMGLGSAIFKTIKKEPKIGNVRPRIVDFSVKDSPNLYNALGLPGLGVKHFVEKLKRHKFSNEIPYGVSIGGDDFIEYFEVFEALHEFLKCYQTTMYYYELNCSCPNTADGKTLLNKPQELVLLLKKIRSSTDAVVSVKLSPDQSNNELLNVVNSIKHIPNLVINVGNTKYATKESLGLTSNDFAPQGGGLSGERLFERTLEMTTLLSSFDIPIIATGGISKIHHIRQLKQAGATLFAMASGIVVDLYCIPKLNDELSRL